MSEGGVMVLACGAAMWFLEGRVAHTVDAVQLDTVRQMDSSGQNVFEFGIH